MFQDGGSVWELKIDPKRFREEMKNSIEKMKNKRDTKRIIKRHILGPTTKFLILKKHDAVRLAECAGPLGRIIGGVRRDKTIN